MDGLPTTATQHAAVDEDSGQARRQAAMARLSAVFDLAYDRLLEKIKGGLVKPDSEASLQMQFALILQAVGDLFEARPSDRIAVELEKAAERPETFLKSGSSWARIDIVVSLRDVVTRETFSCAIELKFFKRDNRREPNNRYDVFADIHNLENYGGDIIMGFLVVLTDSDHYVRHQRYSTDTADFDCRDGASYEAGTQLTYKTSKPYGNPITLAGSYRFQWKPLANGLTCLRLPVGGK